MNTSIQYFGLACVAFIAILFVYALFKQMKNFYQGKLPPPADPSTVARQKNWERIFGIGLVLVGATQIIADLSIGLGAISSFAVGQFLLGVILVVFTFGRGQKTFIGTNSSKGMKAIAIIFTILFMAAYLFIFNFGGLSVLSSH